VASAASGSTEAFLELDGCKSCSGHGLRSRDLILARPQAWILELIRAGQPVARFGGDHDRVETLLIRVFKSNLIEKAPPDSRDQPVIVTDVDHESAAWSERAVAIPVELSTAQLGRLSGTVIAIDQEGVKVIRVPADEIGSIFAMDGESMIVPRYQKLVPQLDDCGVDLRNADGRLMKLPVTVLGERSTAQPNHSNAARLRWQRNHLGHRPRVSENEFMRRLLQHLAL